MLSIEILILTGILYIHLYNTSSRPQSLHRALIPAVLCGLLSAAHLSLLFTASVPAAWICFGPKKNRLKHLLTFSGATITTYIAVQPLSFYLFVPFTNIPQEYASGLGLFFLMLPPVGWVLIFLLKKKTATNTLRLVMGITALLLLTTAILPLISKDKTINDAGAAALNAKLAEGSTLIVPEEIGINRNISDKKIHFLPVRFEGLTLREFQMLSGAVPETYLLQPDWADYSNGPMEKQLRRQWAQITAHAEPLVTQPGQKTVAFYYFPIKPPSPGFTLLKLKEPAGTPDIIRLWKSKCKNPEHTSPSLISLGRLGSFDLTFHKHEKRNHLTVRFQTPDEQGRQVCLLGYSAGKNGFNPPLGDESRIMLVVDLDLPPHLVTKETHLFIQDVNSTLQSKQSAISGGRTLCFVSKRIRRNCKRLNLGIKFTPQKENDQLHIHNAYVIIEKPQPSKEP